MARSIGRLSRKNCSETRNQKRNLSKEERCGIEKLKKRKETGEIVINVTDKPRRHAICSRNIHKSMGDPHVRNDQKVDLKTLEKAKAEMAGHNKAISNIFRMGRDQDREENTG